MKKRNFIIGILIQWMLCCGIIYFLVSCQKKENKITFPHPALMEIDSLLWIQPDSAFLQLHNFVSSPDADSLSVYDLHYCQLLLSELLYKNDCEQTNRNELQSAVEFFDSLYIREVSENISITKATPFLDARAHYMNGVGYFECDSAMEACKEYKKALEIMESHLLNVKNQKQEKQVLKERQKVVWIAMVVLLIIGIVITILIRHKNKKRFREQERIHNIKQAALLNRLKNSNEKLRKLKDEEKQKHYNNSQTTEIHTTSFYEEPICVIIKEKVKQGQFLSNVDYSYYKNYALEKKQIIDLRKAVDFHFNNFTFRISKAYPKLTQNDIDYCCLYLLNLQDADIAALMQRAYNTINERNNKLKKIFGGNNPIQNTVYEIANEFN